MNIDELTLTAEKGSNYSLFLLAWMKSNGVSMNKDVSSAAHLYQKLADSGVVEAMHSLGELLICIDEEVDTKTRAVSWFQKASHLGFIPSQYFLGYCHENGFGIDQDFEKSAEWYEKAALSGHIQANVDLAGLCERCDISNIAENEPRYWYERVADKNGSAAYALGGIYEEGIKVNRDESKSITYYMKASELGNYFASSHLEMVFEMGLLGNNTDRALASKYASIAEEQLKALEQE